MSDTSWYDEGFNREEINKELAKSAFRLPRRFWLKPESSTEITFVTDVPFCYREHNWKMDGSWRNWTTCPRKNCPFCKAGNDPYLAHAWFIIDHSKWVDSDNNEHKDELKLLVVKARAAAVFEREREKREGLRGARFEVFRSDKYAPNCGDHVSFSEKFSDKDIAKLKWWPKQKEDRDGNPIGIDFNNIDVQGWAELLMPKEAEDMRGILRGMRDEQDDERRMEDDKPVRF